ncbi:MAG: four helix bundle protein [Candidatus Omnitrophica bacterium]|nr:four helix bundle protein [Candidatus Omnitrophota bacterium]
MVNCNLLRSKEIKKFEDLEAWQISHKLVLEIYKVTVEFPKEEQYGIVSQLRRAALSVTSNIAEGFSRFHFNDKVKFYYNSRGSLSEVRNCIILAFDLNYLNKDIYFKLLDNSERVLKLINGLIRSIEKQQ